MKLKIKFILFILIIHLVLFGLTIALFPVNKYLFIASEIIIIISFIVSLTLYKSLFRPFKLISSGIQSISDQDFNIKFLKVGQKDMDNLIDVYNKMMDQLRLERAKLSEKHFFLEKLIEASPAGIIILDVNNEIQIINPAAGRILNISGPIEKINQLPSPWNDELDNLKENHPETAGSVVIHLNGINKYKCHKSYFLDRGVKRHFFIIEELTHEIVKAEKKAYEKVVRMMSHEVNNTVGAINSIIDSSIKYLNNQNNPSNEDFTEALKVAKNRNDGLNLFTKNFADIVRIPSPNLQEYKLADLINKVTLLMKNHLENNNIELETIIDPDLPKVKIDIQQIEQVLVNIIKNATEAIQSKGMIRITLKKIPFSLSIENNGDPIPANIQKKLFEPFFTTKSMGQGIGLTLIREILLNHRFQFSLKTRNDGITEFYIGF